jgi:hypothetical protein
VINVTRSKRNLKTPNAIVQVVVGMMMMMMVCVRWLGGELRLTGIGDNQGYPIVFIAKLIMIMQVIIVSIRIR